MGIVRIPKGKEEPFINWLLNNGCEILPPTNDYERIRWKNPQFGVIYMSGKTNTPYAEQAYKAFRTGQKWNGGPISTGRNSRYTKEKKALLLRDGNHCFYCRESLGEDITLEHLIPLTAGGKNVLSNMVLAHEKCNKKMGSKPPSEKVLFAPEAYKRVGHDEKRRCVREMVIYLVDTDDPDAIENYTDKIMDILFDS